MDKRFGKITIDTNWLNEYYPKALQDWIVEDERRQDKLRIAFNKKLEKVQYFLDNDTDDDAKSLSMKQHIQDYINLVLNAPKKDNDEKARAYVWERMGLLGQFIHNNPIHRVEMEEEE